jgi:hypothetical protein
VIKNTQVVSCMVVILRAEPYECFFFFKFQIRMIFLMKSGADYIHRMLAIIQSKIFCLPVSYKKKLKIKIYRTVILLLVLYGCET